MKTKFLISFYTINEETFIDLLYYTNLFINYL